MKAVVMNVSRPRRGVKGDRLIAETIQSAVDSVSLEQALVDVEMANARVIDLTRRLTDAVREIQALRKQMLEQERVDSNAKAACSNPNLSSSRADNQVLLKEVYDLRVIIEALSMRLRQQLPTSPTD